MHREETLISDNEGNYLVVALDFYDYEYKANTLSIPEEYCDIDIVDINIRKLILNMPLGYVAMAKLIRWLTAQFVDNNAIFTFICSIDPIQSRHKCLQPELYRWRWFDSLYKRASQAGLTDGINVQDVIFGPEGYKSYSRAFYSQAQAPIVHLLASHLTSKYSDN